MSASQQQQSQQQQQHVRVVEQQQVGPAEGVTSTVESQSHSISASKELTGLTHECGVFGAIACGDWPAQMDIAHVICLGLVALQHRGQESAGIATSEGNCSKEFNVHKGMGMISTLFNDDSMKKLRGNLGIGHTRYSTAGGSGVVNCQPFVVHTAHGALALAHFLTTAHHKSAPSAPRVDSNLDMKIQNVLK